MINILSAILILAGVFFYLAGSIGLLRLPDLYSRLHALTKADNLGLGLLIAGLSLYSLDLLMMLKLLLIWLAVLAASATSAHLIARQARRQARRQEAGS
jgi:multicomponent Na+:H+ antiporter subunit G